ncbi:MAG: toxic anion resistance protein [Clostridiales Family XIII bacterium]|jgi:uncharacterized protein YaaN involved in tellurite resistance|nr:toxic anion resistance protein [Clostridiales Family XIII bacterium]
MTLDLNLNESNVQAEVKNEITAVKPEVVSAAENKALELVNQITAADVNDVVARTQIEQMINSFGASAVKTADSANKFMRTAIGQLSKRSEDGGEVATSLTRLSEVVDDLDPSALDFMLDNKIGRKIKAYFKKYESADSVIQKTLAALDKGQRELQDDNVTLSLEEQGYIEEGKNLRQSLEVAMDLDKQLSERINEITDPEQKSYLETEVLFPLRVKSQDMQTLLTVLGQAVLSIRIIQRNNKELLRGVDRAKAVTVRALQVGVMVAGALYNQKLVVNALQTVKEVTESQLAANAKLLRQQSAEIAQQASQTTIDPQVLKDAWTDIKTTMEEIAAYRQKALPIMKQTIESFEGISREAENMINKYQA